VRCEQHHLASGPDGRCVLCRRTQSPSAPAVRFSKWWALGAMLLGAGVAYRWAITQTAPAPVAEVIRIGPWAPTTTPIETKAPENIAPRPTPWRQGLDEPTQPSPPRTPQREPALERQPDRAPEPQPRAVSLSDVSIVVYTTGWCPVCRRAKAWMAQQRIPYEERDVESSWENARRMKSINPRGGVPTFDVDGDVMVGFTEESLSGIIRRAAERQAERRRL
jgi:glutaredoxin